MDATTGTRRGHPRVEMEKGGLQQPGSAGQCDRGREDLEMRATNSGPRVSRMMTGGMWHSLESAFLLFASLPSRDNESS